MSEKDFPTGVEVHRGKLRISFMYQGQRRRESIGVPDTAKNRRMASEFRGSILYKIKTGVLDYAADFPESTYAQLNFHKKEEHTLSFIAEKWLQLKSTELAKSSLARYRSRVTNTIEMLGEKRVCSSIRQEDLLELRRSLLTSDQLPGRKYKTVKSGRAVVTVNGCMADLKAIFSFAYENGYIPKSPMSAVSPLRKSRKIPDPLTRDEFPRLLAAFSSRQMKNLWAFAILSGLRHGELCALAWEDVDLIAKTIRISRNITDKGDFTVPKTESSIRTISLIDSAVGVLRDQMELTRLSKPTPIKVLTREYGDSYEEACSFIFNPSLTVINGRSKSHYSVGSLNQTWRSALQRSGIRHRKAYQSRHTYACWSLSAGANPNFIASQMGHANAQMVYQVYGSWMQDNNSAQMMLLNEKLNEFAPVMPPHNNEETDLLYLSVI
ncbi:Arm DNA-binding domain-containing protein [Ewingella americana]